MCGRGGAGIVCATARTTGNGFNSAAWWTTWPDFSDNDGDAGGWQSPSYYRTLRLTDVTGDGRADVCGRSANGIVCANSTGTSFGRYQFKSYRAVFGGGNDYTDALGWLHDSFASTARAASSAVFRSEIINA